MSSVVLRLNVIVNFQDASETAVDQATKMSGGAGSTWPPVGGHLPEARQLLSSFTCPPSPTVRPPIPPGTLQYAYRAHEKSSSTLTEPLEKPVRLLTS